MAQALGTITVPIFMRIGGHEREIGTIEFVAETTPSGKIKIPRPSVIARALKKLKAH